MINHSKSTDDFLMVIISFQSETELNDDQIHQGVSIDISTILSDVMSVMK